MRSKTVLIGLFVSSFIFANAQKTINPKFENKIEKTIDHLVPFITVSEAHREFINYTFLDAREWEEFKVSQINGALHVGYQNLDFSKIESLSKDSNIIVYCSIGYRSDVVGNQLRNLGYLNVYNLYGSIFEWVNQGFEIVDKDCKPTSKLHTYNKDWSKWVENPSIQKIW